MGKSPLQAVRIAPRAMRPPPPPPALKPATPEPADWDQSSADKKTARQKPKKTRAGILNYSSSDVQCLLDIVDSVQPYTAAHWSDVEARYTRWAAAYERPARDADSLKSKFGKLSSAAERTAAPGNPPPVMRARAISHRIMRRVEAEADKGAKPEPAVLEGRTDDPRPPAEPDAEKPTKEAAAQEEPLRVEEPVAEPELAGQVTGKRKRTAAPSELPGAKRADVDLLECIGEMSRRSASLSDKLRFAAMASQNEAKPAQAQVLQREDVQSIVREELKPVQEAMNVMLGMVKVLCEREVPKQ